MKSYLTLKTWFHLGLAASFIMLSCASNSTTQPPNSTTVATPTEPPIPTTAGFPACLSTPCQNNGTCVDNGSLNNYTCNCIPGYNGSECENDINECSSSPCQNGATCQDLVNNYTCACAPGFEGRNCQTNTDECSSIPCKNNGSCTDLINGYSCLCSPGFSGSSCEIDINECDSGPCQNGATCQHHVNNYTCACAPGFEGRNCQTNTDECSTFPCQNNGSCTDLINGYNCSCYPGFTGASCETNIDECLNAPCLNNGTCIDLVNGYNCTCLSGYSGSRCESAIITEMASTSVPTSATATTSVPISATVTASVPISATATTSVPTSATATTSVPISATATTSVPTTATTSVPISAMATTSVPISATATTSVPISATATTSVSTTVQGSVVIPTSATTSVPTTATVAPYIPTTASTTTASLPTTTHASTTATTSLPTISTAATNIATISATTTSVPTIAPATSIPTTPSTSPPRTVSAILVVRYNATFNVNLLNQSSVAFSAEQALIITEVQRALGGNVTGEHVLYFRPGSTEVTIGFDILIERTTVANVDNQIKSHLSSQPLPVLWYSLQVPGSRRCGSPTVKILGRSRVLTITRSSTTTLQTNITLNCSSATIFQWKVWKLPLLSGELPENSELLVMNTAELTLNSRTLDYGMHLVEFKVTMRDFPKDFNSDTIILKVVNSDIVAEIVGGSLIKRGFNKIITLDGSPSEDPDLGAGNYTDMAFYWLCKKKGEAFPPYASLALIRVINVNGPTGSGGCFDTGIGRLSSTQRLVTMDTGRMIVNDWYDILLVVHKPGDRQSKFAQAMQVVSGDPPQISISCIINCGRRISPSSRTKLVTNCTAPDRTCADRPLTYRWELKIWNIGRSVWDRVPGLQSKISTTISSPDIFIKANALGPGRKYRVTVTASAPGITPGESNYDLVTNSPPTGGTCKVTPTEGVVLSTEFKLSCQGWSDSDLPLTYQYFYVTEPGLNSVVTYGSARDVTTKLPLGVASQGYVIVIRFLIIDALSAAAEVKLNAKVETPAPSVGVSATRQIIIDANGNFEQMLQAGDVTSATQLANAMLETLENAPTDTFNSTETIQLVDNIVESMTSQVNVQTLQTLSQVTSVLGRATSNPRDVSLKAQNDTLKALVTLTSLLQRKSSNSDSLDDGMVEAGAENLVLSLGNVLNSASRRATYKPGSLNSEQQESITASTTSVTLVGNVADTLFSKKVIGEPPSLVKTASLLMMLCRQLPNDLEKCTPAGVALPDDPKLRDLVNGYKYVDTQQVSSVFNPYSWSFTSERINSHVTSYDLKNDQGSEIMVSGLTKYIEMYIPNQNSTIIVGSSYSVDSFLQPDKISYHKVAVGYKGVSLVMEVVPNAAIPITLMINRHSLPTQSQNQYKNSLSDVSECDRDNLQQVCRTNTSTYLVSSDLLNTTGTYYIGLIYEKSATKSRKRRSTCFGHGRQKRSCVEPKDPPPPDNMTIIPVYNPNTDVNYTITTWQYSCMYWDVTKWTNAGCKVGPNTTEETLHCLCNHLTSFGGSLLVAPNPIDFKVVLLELTRLDQTGNVAVLVTIIVILLIYIVVAVFAWRADRRDRLRYGPLINISPGNPNGFEYRMTVVTGVWRGCGTTANVAIVIHGSEAVSQPIVLSRHIQSPRLTLASGNADQFIITLPASLGILQHLNVWHDNTGSDPSWFLNYVTISSSTDDKVWNFVYKDWLALEKGDGRINKILRPTSQLEMETFKYTFSHRTNKKFTEDHLWLSVVTKPPYSNFTRLQRATCCLSLLFSVMIVDAMFYRLSTEPDPTIQVGPLKFSWRQVQIGIQSSLIVVPVSLLIVALFQNSRARRSIGEGETSGSCCCCLRNKSRKVYAEDKKMRHDDEVRPVTTLSTTRVGHISIGSLPNRSAIESDCHTEYSDVTVSDRMNSSTITSSLTKIEKDSLNNGFMDSTTEVVPPKIHRVNDHAEEHVEITQNRHVNETQGVTSSKHKLIDEEPKEGEHKTCCEKLISMFSKEQFNEEQCRLPHFCVYVAWLLCFAVVFLSAFFTFSYSLVWGKAIADQWLSSMLVSFTQDLFVIQPLKICIIAVILSCFFRKRTSRELTSGPKELKELAKYEPEMSSFSKETSDKVKHEDVKVSIPEESILKKVRAYKVKESNMFSFVREMSLFLFFLLLLTIVCYGNRSYYGYAMAKAIKDDFNKFSKVTTDAKYWAWLKTKFVPGLYAGSWYNNATETKEEYIGNKMSILIGMPRMRQLKVKQDSCKLPDEVKEIASHCYAKYSFSNEDRTMLYLPGWKTPPLNIPWVNLTKLCPIPWRYSTSQQLEFLPSWGYFHLYNGGGYVADLGYNSKTATTVINTLEANKWVSPRTRAVILEFSAFNVNTNYLVSSRYYYESLPFALGLVYKRVETMALYTTQSGAYEFYLFCILLFILLAVFYFCREIRTIYKTGKVYFFSCWNWIDLLQALAAGIVVLTHIIKEKMLLDAVTKLKKNPYITVSFQLAFSVQEAENIALGFTVSIATVKLLRLVRFNPHIVILSFSLGNAKQILLSYSVLLVIIMGAYAMMFNLIFGNTLKDCSTWLYTFYFELLMSIGAPMKLDELRETDRVLGVMVGFSFKLLMIFIFMNFFVAILNDAYEDVNTNTDRSGEQFEMADFIIERLKELLLRKKYNLDEDRGIINHGLDGKEGKDGEEGEENDIDDSASANSRTLLIERNNVPDKSEPEKELNAKLSVMRSENETSSKTDLETTGRVSAKSRTVMFQETKVEFKDKNEKVAGAEASTTQDVMSCEGLPDLSHLSAYRLRRALRSLPKTAQSADPRLRPITGRTTRRSRASRLAARASAKREMFDRNFSRWKNAQEKTQQKRNTIIDKYRLQVQQEKLDRTHQTLESLSHKEDTLEELVSDLLDDILEERIDFLYVFSLIVSQRKSEEARIRGLHSNLVVAKAMANAQSKLKSIAANLRERKAQEVQPEPEDDPRASRILNLWQQHSIEKKASKLDKALIQSLLQNPEIAYLSDDEILSSIFALQQARKKGVPEHLRMKNFLKSAQEWNDDSK